MRSASKRSKSTTSTQPKSGKRVKTTAEKISNRSSSNGIWDTLIPQDVFPDFLAAIPEETFNDFLSVHRTKDKDRYSITREFSTEEGANFIVEAIVGGDRDTRSLTPLQIDFQPERESAGKSIHKYPKSPDPTVVNPGTRDIDEIVITARNCSFVFSWNKVDGASWSHTVRNIRFYIRAEVILLEAEGEHTISFRATELSIEEEDFTSISEGILAALQADDKEADENLDDEKISDLFIALLQIAATELAGNLAGSVELPAFDVGDFQAFPRVLRLQQNHLVVAAELQAGDAIVGASSTFASRADMLHAAFAADIENAGGPLAILYGDKFAEEVRSLPVDQLLAVLEKRKPASDTEIRKRLPLLEAANATISSNFAKGTASVTARPSVKRKATVANGAAIAVSEYFLDKLVSRYGNSYEKSCTRTLKLGLVKGRLCYEFSAQNPDVQISNTGLTGSVDIYAFAGLEYWVKKFWDCSWRWDGPHLEGIGIRGRPSLSLRTIANNKGLRIRADFDLRNVELFTGSPLIDALLKLLSPLFMKVLEAFLDALANLLSFFVIPAKMEVGGQKTYIAFSNFTTSRYDRNIAGAAPSQLTFLRVTADTTAK